MMKLKTLITVLFLILAVAPGFAGEPVPSTAEAGKNLTIKRQVKSSIYELVYLTDSRRSLLIILQDDEGNTLLKKRLRVEASVKIPINLKLLPYGNYTFIIRDNDKTIKKAIHYREMKGVEKKVKVSLSKEKDPKNFKLIAIGAYHEPLDVLIFDKDNYLIHRDRIKVGIQNFSRVYDLSKIPAVHFTFKVYNNNLLISNTIF